MFSTGKTVTIDLKNVCLHLNSALGASDDKARLQLLQWVWRLQRHFSLRFAAVNTTKEPKLRIQEGKRL